MFGSCYRMKANTMATKAAAAAMMIQKTLLAVCSEGEAA
jgi:hypothetical protein